MKIKVLFFASARDLADRSSLEMEFPQGTTVGQLRAALAEEFPALADLLPRSMVAIGTEYATDTTLLDDNAETAIIPPVSGG